jgi:hypothetical protein
MAWPLSSPPAPTPSSSPLAVSCAAVQINQIDERLLSQNRGAPVQFLPLVQ